MGGLIAIYDMYDEEGNAFYVGQTSRPIEKRRDEHYDRCRWERTDTALKVRELRARGIKPGVRLLERVAPDQADERENWHIDDHEARGYRLTNSRRRALRPPYQRDDNVVTGALTLRLPLEMYAALKRLAEREDRSLHAQMLRAMRSNREIRQEMERERAGMR